jgi:hypothetical protein
MEGARHLLGTCYYIKSVYGSIVGKHGKTAHVHHPQALGITSVYNIYVSAAYVIISPDPINPTTVSGIKMVHARFLNLLTVLLENLYDFIFAGN